MTFHGFLPALDSSGVPATLSPLVMSDLLRRDMHFDGLLITDAMDMAGVIDRFGAVEAAKRAIAAGNDILLMPADVPGAIDAVVGGMAEGRYTEQRLNASVRRILLLKDRLGLRRQKTVPLDRVRAVVGDSSHVALARRDLVLPVAAFRKRIFAGVHQLLREAQEMQHHRQNSSYRMHHPHFREQLKCW